MKYLIFLFFSISILQSGNSQVIYDFQTHISYLQNNGQAATATEILDLHTNLHPTGYFLADHVESTEDKFPFRIVSDVGNLEGAGSEELHLDKVKIVNVLIRNHEEILNGQLSAKLVSRLTSLKYIVLISEFNASPEDFAHIVSYVPGGVLILNKRSITE